ASSGRSTPPTAAPEPAPSSYASTTSSSSRRSPRTRSRPASELDVAAVVVPLELAADGGGRVRRRRRGGDGPAEPGPFLGPLGEKPRRDVEGLLAEHEVRPAAVDLVDEQQRGVAVAGLRARAGHRTDTVSRWPRPVRTRAEVP